MFDGGWIGWVFLRALNGAHATSENSKQIRVLRKKTLCSPWLRGGIKFNRTVRKSLYEEIKGHQKDVEDLRKKKKRRRCKCNISSYIYD